MLKIKLKRLTLRLRHIGNGFVLEVTHPFGSNYKPISLMTTYTCCPFFPWVNAPVLRMHLQSTQREFGDGFSIVAYFHRGGMGKLKICKCFQCPILGRMNFSHLVVVTSNHRLEYPL